ncbi:MAG: Eco57I restriction-modification methylase domain-containing protein, partial [bacterium]
MAEINSTVFYRFFLLKLFHEGLAKEKKDRSSEFRELLGDVPFLNGGLFDVHDLEHTYKNINIKDDAFEKLFVFFDNYQWHLDDRPLRNDNEINPDVLGYIFEKYINQKEMGAYYTKEDITGYISRNTIIPYLFQSAEKVCSVAFKPGGSVWRLLQDNPDRYIYDAMKKGVHLDIPPEIAKGIKDVSKREKWNTLAREDYALPTEIWREYIARRQRYEEVHQKLAQGEINNINDLITYNLDIEKFAEDVIVNAEGTELVKAFWDALNSISILDPTCGSGAFLFAALNILEPLYTRCLESMQGFVEDLESSTRKHHPDKLKHFKDVLAEMERHPNRRYFILKSIIINNLYGVDIMEEAVEICKLRLFLKLAAQVEDKDRIEPLPDIDFNIRAGNTLVGFASLGEVKKTLQDRFIAEDKELVREIENKAEDADHLFQQFRQMQTEKKMNVKEFHQAKQELRERLNILRNELDHYLSGEYGIKTNKQKEFEKWRESHQPFHWFIEFYGIMHNGGFDVIIGNPPYVEVRQIRNYILRDLNLISTGNLYSVCLERFTKLLRNEGLYGVIVPISSISTPRMLSLMEFLSKTFNYLIISNFAVRPGKLFNGVDMNLSIFIGYKTNKIKEKCLYTSRYNRWYNEFRPYLFQQLSHSKSTFIKSSSSIPKIGTKVELQILEKLYKLDNFSIFTPQTENYEII